MMVLHLPLLIEMMNGNLHEIRLEMMDGNFVEIQLEMMD